MFIILNEGLFRLAGVSTTNDGITGRYGDKHDRVWGKEGLAWYVCVFLCQPECWIN